MPLSDADKEKIWDLMARRKKLQSGDRGGLGVNEVSEELRRIEKEIGALRGHTRGTRSIRVNVEKIPRRSASPLMGNPSTPPPRGRKDD